MVFLCRRYHEQEKEIRSAIIPIRCSRIRFIRSYRTIRFNDRILNPILIGIIFLPLYTKLPFAVSILRRGLMIISLRRSEERRVGKECPV